MPYITTKSGIKWHYKTKGIGEILFFIHGWSSEGDVWQDQVEYFCNRYRVITIDLPGHGKTNWKNIDFNTLVIDLSYILDQFEQKINLVATSFSGALAIKLASGFDGLIKKLILVDTSAKFVSADDFSGALEQKELDELKSLIKVYYPNGLLMFYRKLFSSFEKIQKNFPSVWKKFKYRKQFPNKKALLKFLDMIDSLDLRQDLQKIKIPTLVIAGNQDKLFKRECHKYLAENIQNSKVLFLENLGHVPFLTNPNAFNRALDEFLLSKQAVNITATAARVFK